MFHDGCQMCSSHHSHSRRGEKFLHRHHCEIWDVGQQIHNNHHRQSYADGQGQVSREKIRNIIFTIYVNRIKCKNDWVSGWDNEKDPLWELKVPMQSMSSSWAWQSRGTTFSSIWNQFKRVCELMHYKEPTIVIPYPGIVMQENPWEQQSPMCLGTEYSDELCSIYNLTYWCLSARCICLQW